LLERGSVAADSLRGADRGLCPAFDGHFSRGEKGTDCRPRSSMPCGERMKQQCWPGKCGRGTRKPRAAGSAACNPARRDHPALFIDGEAGASAGPRGRQRTRHGVDISAAGSSKGLLFSSHFRVFHNGVYRPPGLYKSLHQEIRVPWLVRRIGRERGN